MNLVFAQSFIRFIKNREREREKSWINYDFLHRVSCVSGLTKEWMVSMF